ncbi:glycosyltransferase family 4 protein [Halobacteriovorax sp. HLS]|uniref:glycosyltransferase family 4 protein n=1 Tax=Halobacteriovorax sp. HLS TaxID=2234000 RepID=UPI000FDB5D4C|nr:glycosyltransferase family 4 protein [Halobacteriovorax sp. HLS]
MKVLIVTPFKNFPGGVESYNQLIESILIKNGHEVEYLTTDGEVSTLLRLKSKVFGLPTITANRFCNIDSSIYDLIICNGEFNLGIEHPNVINIFHGSYIGLRDFTKSQISLKYYLSLTWQGALQVKDCANKKIVTVSQFNASQLRKQNIIVSSILLNPVDTSKFKPVDHIDRSGILNVGTFKEWVKGFDLLKKLSFIRDDLTCVTDIRPDFNCRWIESTPDLDIVNIYQSHKIVVIPSRFESASLVALEAMACGVPIVMNRVGYAFELEKEIEDFVMSPEDLNDGQKYHDRIEKILSNYDFYSTKAREYVMQYHSLEVFEKNFCKLVNDSK